MLAVAVVGAVFVTTLAWMLAGLVFRRRVQFGLRTLLVFVTLCAVVCSWLAVRLREARRQAAAVATMREKFDAVAWYDWELDYSDYLVNTKVTKESVKKLQRALPQCKIEVCESRE